MDFINLIIPFSFFLLSVGVLSYFIQNTDESYYTKCCKKRSADEEQV